jgi:YfiH family protein
MKLPQPGDAFEWTDAFGRAVLICRPLAPFAHHIFTSRLWPLATSAGANPGEVWNGIAHAVGADGARLLRARQVHGAAVVAHREGEPIGQPADADILVTNDPRVAAVIQTADCVPVLLADTRTGAVAAAHAGWRGLAQRVPLAAVEAMVREFGTRESTLIAAIGPAIGACCYEVGGEVRERFAAAGFGESELSRWFRREAQPSPVNPSMSGLHSHARADHWFLDVWSTAREQLRAAGVREDRIFAAELCTASHPDALCSYRRDGSSAGRMAAAIRRSDVHG